jgi:hypothetical protein
VLHWNLPLTYFITPKSGPLRGLRTLIDANRAILYDLPAALRKQSHWLSAAKLLVSASESGDRTMISAATDALVVAIENEGWMSSAQNDEAQVAGGLSLPQ